MNNERASLKKKEGSFSQFLRIYRKTRIPWVLLALVVLISFGTQLVSVNLVEYTSKIDTGTMTGGTFLVGYVLYSALSIIFEYGYDLANTAGHAVMSRNVRKKVWGKLLRMPVSAYEDEDSQTLVSRISKDTDNTYGAITAVIQVVSVLYGMIIALIEVVKLFGSYTWILAAIIPVMVVCSILLGKIEYRIERLKNDAYADMTNYYSERLPNMTYIKTNGMEEAEYEKGAAVSNAKYRADVVYKALYALSLPLQSLGNYISLVFVLLTASAMVRAGTLASADMKALLGYFDILMQNAVLLMSIWGIVKMSHGGNEKIAEIYDAEEEPEDGEAVPALSDLVFENVSFGYTKDRTVLNHADFTVPAGKFTAVVGENGCGKSTIMRLLERFHAPKEGVIYAGNEKLEDLDLKSWRSQVGYVFQGNQMLEGTVKENLVYGLDNVPDEDEIKEVLEGTDCGFVYEKENGLDTPVEVFDSVFSGGQMQRLSIARALLKNPEYLILDEAASGLDRVSETKVMDYVMRRMQGKTVLCISHDMDVIEKADHIVVIGNGTVEAEGSFEEVKETSETMKRFLEVEYGESSAEVEGSEGL